MRGKLLHCQPLIVCFLKTVMIVFYTEVTFKMIMMLAMYIIETNPYIKQALQMTYSFVFLDEFQDTTAIQYAFVKECFWNSGTKVTSVGDNKQRIMVWAGAVKTIFNDFYRELNPKCIRLIMNHRSAPRLVALQKAMYILSKRVISMGHTIFHCFVVPKQLHDRHKEFNDRQWSESSRCGCKIKAFANL